MRIVAGRFRGRVLKAPPGQDTRPTTDRVREAMFSAIASLAGFDLGGGTVLDAFAGSGVLGLEALSRGCSHAVFVEQAPRAITAIRGNITTLGVDASTNVVAGNVFALGQRHGLPHAPYSLLLLDPPYRLDPATVGSLITSLAASGQLADGSVVTWEYASTGVIKWPEGFSGISSKRYGSTRVDMGVYQRGA